MVSNDDGDGKSFLIERADGGQLFWNKNLDTPIIKKNNRKVFVGRFSVPTENIDKLTSNENRDNAELETKFNEERVKAKNNDGSNYNVRLEYIG